MTPEQVQRIAQEGRFPGPKTPVSLIETHISWVILTPAFAFKIKKNLRFSFLDFSTPERRAFFCAEELRLNRRLAPDMYLDVLPILPGPDGQPEIAAANAAGTPVDAALRMKRLDNRFQMDHLLQQHAVQASDMELLAAHLARFHQSVRLSGPETAYRPGDNRADFDDLFRLKPTAQELFGPAAAEQFDAWQTQTRRFLDAHETRLHQRADGGFWVEGHGDLHARNIFLLPDGPVAFDCIEFNAHFRRLDVLNELAFLCMDLDAPGQPALATAFLDAYCRHWPCIESPEDERLFHYFKTYRANVRLKIALLELEEHPSPPASARAGQYRLLLEQYFAVWPA